MARENSVCASCLGRGGNRTRFPCIHAKGGAIEDGLIDLRLYYGPAMAGQRDMSLAAVG